jgi:hypothetical protein
MSLFSFAIFTKFKFLYLRNKWQIICVESDGPNPSFKVVLAEIEHAVKKVSQVPQQLKAGTFVSSVIFGVPKI